MKKRILLITLIVMSFGIKAQNTFPPTGNVSIGNSYTKSILNVLQKPDDGQAHIFLGNPYSETQSGVVSSRLCFAGTGIQHAGLAWVPDSGNSNGNGKLHLAFGGYQNPMKNPIKMTFQSNGNVGIGTTNASSILQLMNGNDGISFDSSEDWIGIGFNRSVRNGQIFDTNKSGWQFTARNDRFSLEGYNGAFSNLLNVLKNGNIGIGTITTGTHKLAVEGSIGAREIKVESNGWSDFVFENDYKLPTLIEVENYIKEKGHLKDIPSAKEVEKNGFYLGEMDAKLLQKIEELTLYTIAQEKKIEKVEKENESLKFLTTQFLKLQKRLEKLEKK